MILVLGKDHTHYSDAFGNIFEEDTLHKKRFPDGPDGIKMSKGGAAHAIVCHFCPKTCLNDNYAYHHLAAMHLNLQWGCTICFGFMNGYLSKIREHVQSHQKRSSREQSHSSRKKDKDEGLGSTLEHVSSEEGLVGDSQGEEDDHKLSSCESNGVSLGLLQSLLYRLHRLACHPTSLEVDYTKGTAWPPT